MQDIFRYVRGGWVHTCASHMDARFVALPIGSFSDNHIIFTE